MRLQRLVVAGLLMLASGAFAGDCVFKNEQCVEGAETRFFAGVPVYKDCWKWEATYSCYNTTLTPDGTCNASVACTETSSTCDRYLPGTTDYCMEETRRFTCPSGDVSTTTLNCGGDSYCVDGSCFDTSYEANTDMAAANAGLAIAQGFGEDMNQNNLDLFSGEMGYCSWSLIGGADCCDGGDGLLSALGGQCQPEEQMFKEKRDAGLCHVIGNYCSQEESLTNTCYEREKVGCCFSSKLARVIHEQGRPQLSIGWGTTAQPNCRAFTVDEINQLDFSQMDLSEVAADMANSLDASTVEGETDDMIQRIQNYYQ